MARPLADQVVVVTGASSGIGRATAAAFARAGARVVLSARNREALDAAAAEVGGETLVVPADVTDSEQVRAVAAAAAGAYGRIDTWVNAAAVTVYARVEDTTPEEFERVLRVNVLGHVHGVHAALPELRRAGGGTIVGISSVAGVRAVPLQSAYVASKWAVRGFYDVLRMELARDGVPVSVTTVLPWSVDTPLFAHARSKLCARPRPVPPVYAPEAVARAIVRAAERPVREVVVGGAALSGVLGQRLAPALTDRFMTLRGLMFAAQRSGAPDDGVDNLDAPVLGPGSVRGDWTGPVARRSGYTDLVASRPVVTRLVPAVAGGLLVRRLVRGGRT